MKPLAELGADPLHESWVSTMPTSDSEIFLRHAIAYTLEIFICL